VSTAIVRPGTANGSVVAPPSKSYTHRALVAAHLAHRRFDVVTPLESDDTAATIRAVRALGSSVRRQGSRWIVTPSGRVAPRPRIDCGESGTTLRFASALAALERRPVRLVGRGRLPLRPLRSLAVALEQLGARFDSPAAPRSLPAVVTGPIHGGRISVDASESSQFVSALLLALPTVRPSSELRLPSDPVSRPYIDATRAVLRACGVRTRARPRRFDIPGGQHYAGRSFVVPSDASSAAYLWAAAAISGGSVTVREFDAGWPQADLAVLDLLRSYGATVRRSARSITVIGGERRPFVASFDGSPDLFPLAGVLAAAAPGTSRLDGGTHVAAKESDRRAETVRLARGMGARARLGPGSLRIEGRRRVRAFRLRGAADHRVVMSAAVGALAGDGPSQLSDAGSVRKSYPDFWVRFERLTGSGRVA